MYEPLKATNSGSMLEVKENKPSGPSGMVRHLIEVRVEMERTQQREYKCFGRLRLAMNDLYLEIVPFRYI